MSAELELHVNGSVYAVPSEPERSLLTVLRDELRLTGAKYGCGEAMCGACVVLIDGQPGPTCILPVGAVGSREIRAVESLGDGGRLHPVQQAFLDADALQCGYCTPGMVVGAVALLEENVNPSEAEIIQALDKHICRCGAYRRILRAVQLAAERMRASSNTPATPTGGEPA